MSKKIIRGFRTNMALYGLCLIAFVIVTIPFEPLLALAEAAVAAVVLLVGSRRNKMAQASVRQYMDRVSGGMDSARSSNMLYAPLPMLVFDATTGEVLWSNDMFLQLTSQKEKIFEMLVDTVVPDFSYRWLLDGKREYPELFHWNGRIYRVFGALSHPEEMQRDQNPLATTYWMDVTDSEEMRQTLELTRPLVAILMVDNYEELMKACPESKRSAVLAALEEQLNDWAANSGGLLLGYDRDRYLFVFEEKDYGGYTEKKFDVLEKVRQVQAGEGVYATLSIGVGRDEDSFDQLFKNASLALEMALSRGGDQAVVKDRVNFEFYGGRSKSTEKRTKVKSRVMANALGELIDDAKQVYVMGHKYADMDSVGAAMGVCCIARKRGKKCQIVIDTENNAAHPLIRRMQAQPEYAGVLTTGGEAFLKCQPGTLLVVVDTNRPESVESEEMLETCNRVAVIDHHRRGSSYIEKMALNYHEPYASSASELVAELMQYLVEPSDVLKCEAEALLAGIVLDTKNFINRTGGRTFEAAAFLRRLGADTQDVQRLFQGDLQSMIDRYAIIRQAELYHDDIAVVALEEECDRVTAAKAAWHPQVYAFANYNMIKHYLTIPEPDWIAGIGLKFTLWDNKDRNASIAAANSLVTKAQAAHDEARNRIQTAVQTAYLKSNEAREAYRLTDSTLSLAKENLRLREKGFSEGLSTADEVNDARTKLLAAEIARRVAAYRFVVAWAMLNATCGDMNAFEQSVTRQTNIFEY